MATVNKFDSFSSSLPTFGGMLSVPVPSSAPLANSTPPLNVDMGFSPRLTADSLGIRRPYGDVDISLAIAALFAENNKLRLKSVTAGNIAMHENMRSHIQLYFEISSKVREIEQDMADALQRRDALEAQQAELENSIREKQAELDTYIAECLADGIEPDPARVALLQGQLGGLNAQLGNVKFDLAVQELVIMGIGVELDDLSVEANKLWKLIKSSEILNAMENSSIELSKDELVIASISKKKEEVDREAGRQFLWSSTSEERAIQYIEDGVYQRRVMRPEVTSPDIRMQIERRLVEMDAVLKALAMLKDTLPESEKAQRLISI